MLFYKFQICSYDDQGVDAKSISSKSEFTWIHFVKFFLSQIQSFYGKIIQRKSVFSKIWVYFEPLR